AQKKDCNPLIYKASYISYFADSLQIAHWLDIDAIFDCRRAVRVWAVEPDAAHSPAARCRGLSGKEKLRNVARLPRVTENTATMRIDQAVNIEDLHRMAKRRLPKIAFDFIEGGLEDERGLETNTSAFHKHKLLPRYLVDVSKRDQSKSIFGQTFASPFGISPT